MIAEAAVTTGLNGWDVHHSAKLGLVTGLRR